MALSKPRKVFKFPFDWQPKKRLIIEIIGGGDADGCRFDTNSTDPAIAEQALSMYRMTGGGEVGHSMVGISAGAMFRLLLATAATTIVPGNPTSTLSYIARKTMAKSFCATSTLLAQTGG